MPSKKRCKLGYGNGGRPSLHTVDGITDTLSGWAFRIGCRYCTLYQRIQRGYSPEDAIRAGADNLSNKFLTVNGETHTLAEWGRKTGLDADRISVRIKELGWSPEEAVGQKPHVNQLEKRLTYCGKTRNVAQWARELGISEAAMRSRLREFEKGKLARRCVFAEGKLDPLRKGRHVKYQNWYRGRRLKLKEIARRKGCGTTAVQIWLSQGYTATQILDNPAINVSHDPAEMHRKRIETRRRNDRIRELKQLGLII